MSLAELEQIIMETETENQLTEQPENQRHKGKHLESVQPIKNRRDSTTECRSHQDSRKVNRSTLARQQRVRLKSRG